MTLASSIALACKGLLAVLVLSITCPLPAKAAPPTTINVSVGKTINFKWTHGGGGGGGSTNFPGTYYAIYANGVPATTTFFPIAIYGQSPQQTTAISASCANVAACAKAEGINIFQGIFGTGTHPVPASCNLYGATSPCVNEYGYPESYGGDSGELAAIKAQGLYMIGGGDPSGNTSAASVASVLALAATDGATANVIGYLWNDEPPCPGTNYLMAGNTATEVAAIKGYDATREPVGNVANWVGYYGFNGSSYCAQDSQNLAAFTSPAISSFDEYPMLSPYVPYYCAQGAHVAASDYISTPYDCLWNFGLGTSEAIILIGGQNIQPFWQYIDPGTDANGESSGAGVFLATVNGTTTLQATGNNSGTTPTFTSAWVGMTVAGTDIPSNTTISSITDGTHAVMNHAATGSATGVSVTVTGGGGTNNSDCVVANNLCLVNGNEFRMTPVQVNSAAWESLISGANGIEWFPFDSCSGTFWAGDPGCSGSTTVQANITYVDGVIATYATELNATTTGICTMQNQNLTTATSCTNGILTMATGTAAVPGLAMTKSLNGVTYLFAQSDRNSTNGATMTFTLTGLAGKTATVAYDSNSKYDVPNDSTGATHVLNGSAQFTDTIGAHSDNYQVKIYMVQ